MGYKRKVSYSHYSHIQSYSIFNSINASGFSVPQGLFFQVLMFVQHYPPSYRLSLSPLPVIRTTRDEQSVSTRGDHTLLAQACQRETVHPPVPIIDEARPP
jgi:hypothetical protein